ncbi:MAG: copper homeostasis protein CutC [Bacteroidales bacterium]|nr:copper homeostasis protein CutC [Bacteroidales bacterium]
MNSIITEVCASSLNSVLAAVEGRADRIELCQALPLDGLTPSHALISYCRNNISIPVFVLIRPREGDFIYNDNETMVMMEDIDYCRRLGISGVVLGFLDKDGGIDKDRLNEAVKKAGAMEVTFHRAFDVCADWERALEDIIESGCSRVLTSGQAADSYQGRERLKQIVAKAGDRITILVGGGITPGNVREILDYTKAKELHFSAKSPFSDNGDEVRFETSSELVRKIVSIVNNLTI